MSVLYDEPGPRAKRVTIIGSVIAALLAAAALYFFVYRPLDAKGQFSMVKWGPLVDPSNQYFDLVWARLWEGAQATLKAAGLAIVCAIVLGLILGVLRLQLRSLSNNLYRGLPHGVALFLRGITWTLNFITRLLVEFFRGIPVVITIFFAWALLGGGLVPLVVGLTIYNGVVIAEIIRSGMEGLPKGQREAAASIGLSQLQTTWLILLPQAIRIMLPALISQMVVILKDTALGGIIIGYQELVNTGKQVAQAIPLETFDQESYNPIQMFLVIGIMFILVNYALSKLAQYLERKLSTRTSGKRDLTKAAQLTGLDTGGGIPVI